MLEVLTGSDKKPYITPVKTLLFAVAIKEFLKHLTLWKYNKFFFSNCDRVIVGFLPYFCKPDVMLKCVCMCL